MVKQRCLQVAQAELKHWNQLQVHFGSSIANICRGMRAGAIAQVFQQDSICVRGYDLLSGAPAVEYAEVQVQGLVWSTKHATLHMHNSPYDVSMMCTGVSTESMCAMLR